MTPEIETAAIPDNLLELQAKSRRANDKLAVGLTLTSMGGAALLQAPLSVEYSSDEATVIQVVMGVALIVIGSSIVSGSERMKDAVAEKAKSAGLNVKNNLFRVKVSPSE